MGSAERFGAALVLSIAASACAPSQYPPDWGRYEARGPLGEPPSRDERIDPVGFWCFTDAEGALVRNGVERSGDRDILVWRLSPNPSARSVLYRFNGGGAYRSDRDQYYYFRADGSASWLGAGARIELTRCGGP